MLESIGAWKNARYSEDLSKNTKRGLHYVISVHNANFTHLPFGYKRVEIDIGKRRDGTNHILHRLEIDPTTSQMVKTAFTMRLHGATYHEINEAVHIYSWLNKYGKMLSNPIYIGTFRYGGMDYPNYCDPLVDMDTWNAVQEVNRQRRQRYGYNHPRSVRSNYLLTGLIFCGNCGSRMAGRMIKQRKPYTTRYYYYVCQSENSGTGRCGANYIPQDEIESVVIEAVKSRILQRDILMQVYEEVQAQQSVQNETKDTKISVLMKAMADNERQINHILTAIKEAGHSRALLVQLNQLEEKQAELQQQIAQMDSHPKMIPDNIQLMYIIEYIQNELASADRIKLAQVLRHLIVKVTIIKNVKLKGEIIYRLPFPGAGNYMIEL